MIKCLVINPHMKNQNSSEVSLNVRPIEGDAMPVNYIDEKVERVVVITELVNKEYPYTKGHDLLIYLR